MSGQSHDHGALAGLVLGGLEPEEHAAVEAHLAGCALCRRERDELEQAALLLAGLPPEALLEGPPDDGDLLLQRTLRQARSESIRIRWTRRAGTAAAAVALVAAGSVGGAMLTPTQVAAPPPPASTASPTPLPEGTVTAASTDPDTRARMTVTVIPAAGWVRIRVEVSGIPEGQRCLLYVVAADGTRTQAGGWLVSETGAAEGVTLDGTALVPLDDVTAIEVETDTGTKYVTTRV